MDRCEDQGFADIKKQATLLFHPKPDAPTCDASNVAIGAVLQQFIDSQWCPVSFFSRSTETHYSTFDHELLAIYLSIKHFQHFVEGHNFHVITNHIPLTFAISSQASHYTPRQIQHLDYVSKFTTDIQVKIILLPIRVQD